MTTQLTITEIGKRPDRAPGECEHGKPQSEACALCAWALAPGGTPAAVASSGGILQTYLDAATPENTRRAYRHRWKSFLIWCDAQGVSPLPASPITLAHYIAMLAEKGYAASTIECALAAISQAHKAARVESPRSDPLVRRIRRGIRRKIGTAPRKAAPLPLKVLAKVIKRLDLTTLAGLRDRALLLVGFLGAFRRSELAGLQIEDLRRRNRGYDVRLRRSKTDQEGVGRDIAIPVGRGDLCPVAALDAWIAQAPDTHAGPLFVALPRRKIARSIQPAQVREILRRRCGDAYTAHSLRHGFAVAADRAGASEKAIQKTTGHKSLVVLRGYLGDERWRECAARGLLDAFAELVAPDEPDSRQVPMPLVDP